MQSRVKLSLLLLRYTVFLVLLFWTLDKFIRPEHAAGVYDRFYHLTGFGRGIMTALAVLETVLIIGFALGIRKRVTYTFVFVVHGISTLSSFHQYSHPFENLNLLFFAAWPMWAACLALLLLRDEDTMLTIPSA